MRNRLIAMLFLAATLCLAASAATAAVPGGPTETIKRTVDNVIGIVTDPQLAGQAQPRRTTLTKAIEGVFDAQELARRAVAQNWERFNPDQKTRFTNAFLKLLERTYMDRIESYTDQKVEYLGETMHGEDKAEVATKVLSKGIEIPITYRLIKKNTWCVYDVVIEGVSLVQNYRNQFSQILMKESPDQLIARVDTMNDKPLGGKTQ